MEDVDSAPSLAEDLSRPVEGAEVAAAIGNLSSVTMATRPPRTRWAIAVCVLAALPCPIKKLCMYTTVVMYADGGNTAKFAKC